MDLILVNLREKLLEEDVTGRDEVNYEVEVRGARGW